jgi:hypothetical protein
MPVLTRAFIKTAMVCFALGLALGVAMALGAANSFFPVYIHLLVFGWLTQLIFGVIYWMFPKYSTEKPRGSETLGWWTYALLNLGLLLRMAFEPLNAQRHTSLTGWMLALAAVLQFLSGLLFVVNSWARVREK